MLYDRSTAPGPTTPGPTMVDDSHARDAASSSSEPSPAARLTVTVLGARMHADPLHAAEVLRKVKARMFDRSAAPTRVGRYELGDLIGSGGMGVVYSAYDPDLQRRVALKSLREGDRTPVELQRLRREAQALAMLSHPNVVGVHGLIESEYGVFVVMELIEGPTLGDWLVAESRSVTEILRVFRGVGQGLEAAHAAGLVHRDVKPGNVLLDPSGTPKVVDFGLARGRPESTVPLADDPPSDVSLTARLTRVGGVVGTPWYMPPEQFEGRPVDARSDQFAFCVALYEALYRTPPFAAGTLEQRLDAIERGALEEPVDPPKVPTRVHEALVRGLKADPDDRWPGMGALLERLRERGPRRRWVVTLALGGAGLVALLASMPRAQEVAGCGRVDAALDGVWDRSARTGLQREFTRAGGSAGESAWPRLGVAIDTYASQWREAYGETCAARGDASVRDEQFDRRMACLLARRRELSDAIGLLGETTPAAAGRSTEVIVSLTPGARCLTPSADPVPPPSAEQEADVAAVRAKVAASRALGRLARYDESHRAVREALQSAEDAGYVPATVEARLQWAAVLSAEAEYAAATQEATRAFWVAKDAGLDRLAATAAVHLVDASVRRGRYDEGARWAAHAQATVARLDNAGGLAADLALERGELARAQYRFEDALEHFRGAQRLRSERSEASRLDTAEAQLGVGGALAALERHEEAHVIYAEVAQELEALLGPNHPTLGRGRSNLGVTAYELGDLDEALVEFDAALDIYRVALGEDHPRTGRIHAARGAALARAGRPAAARRAFEEALRISRAAFGDEHPRVVDALNGLAGVLTAERDFVAATQRLRKALTIQESMHGEDSPRLTALLGNLANAENGARRHARAQRYAERALELIDSSVRPYTTAELELHLAVALIERVETRPKAAAVLEQAARRLSASGAPEGMRRYLLITQGDLASRQGRPSAALEKYDEAQRLLDAAQAGAATTAQLTLRRLEATWATGDSDRLEVVAAEALAGIERAAADPEPLRRWLAGPMSSGPPVTLGPTRGASPR